MEVQREEFAKRNDKYAEILPERADFPADHQTPELLEFVCTMAMMGVSLNRMCQVPGMPSSTQVTRWLVDNADFEQKYARAKEVSAETMLDEILDIADNTEDDYTPDNYMRGNTPGYQVNTEHIQRSKLRVETRFQLMSLLKPKKYGRKVDMTTNGKDLPSQILGVLNVNSEVVDRKSILDSIEA